ncbi:MAG: alpha/beta hydrolase [Pseudomonadota bacterium]
MFVVTNRQVSNRKGLGQFGKKPNEKGPHEIRLFDVQRSGRRWEVELLDDVLHHNTVRALIDKHGLEIDQGAKRYASLKVACDIAEQARCDKKNIVIYVHGYNNDMDDVLRSAQAIAETHGVIVVPFSWPANGGGAVSGTLSYKADKRDARASVGAFDRMLMKSVEYLNLISEGRRRRLWLEASKRHKHNQQERDALYAKLLDRECPFTVNLMLHSMGNYLYKQLLKSTASEATTLLFDNVILAAADVNNADHAAWLDRIRCRKRVYVAINENDFALRASRAKAGEAQLARLGHVTYGLHAEKAVYVDFTDAKAVGSSHGYFIGEPVQRNTAVKHFFRDALNGARAERMLDYDAEKNVYRL